MFTSSAGLGRLAFGWQYDKLMQNNTSKMIVDNEFLSQEEVAEMVLTLSDDTISKLINGRVIPNDRVFYPVKPIVGTSVDANNIQDLKEKVVVITTTSSKALSSSDFAIFIWILKTNWLFKDFYLLI